MCVATLKSLPNVFVKISGLWTVNKSWDAGVLAPFINVLLDSFGADRVLYGSNAPVEEVNCSVSRQFERLKITLKGRSKKEQQAMLCGTARRLYGFDQL